MTPDELSARHRAADAVAREAGDLAQSYLAGAHPLAVELKGPQDVVTAADDAVERMIVDELRSWFPDDAFIGEEGGGAAADACWVIDPIDGTANFARGLPHWCVSIAFVAAGRTELGVIYDPNGDLLYPARRAGAQCCCDPRERYGRIPPRDVDIGYSRAPFDDFARIMTRLLERGVNAALAVRPRRARVADGRLDGR